METLPRELVRAIIRDQSREDLHNVRLVNRIFAAEASPFLFHTVPVWISLKSLDHFTCLSEHPILSQYVEKVVFSPLRFVEYKDEAAYQASVRDAMEYQPESLSGHALKLGRHIVCTPWRDLIAFKTTCEHVPEQLALHVILGANLAIYIGSL